MSRFFYMDPFGLEFTLSNCYCARDFLPHVLNIRGKVYQVDIEEISGYDCNITDYCIHSFVFNERQLLDKVFILQKKLGALKPSHKAGIYCFYNTDEPEDDNTGIFFKEGQFIKKNESRSNK